MSSKQTGMTLIELIMAIVIIGVGLAGVMIAFSNSVRHSADPLQTKQMLGIAEAMLEEVLLQPLTGSAGSISGCDRANAQVIGDYAAYNAQPVCDLAGNPIASLAGYRVSVSLDPTATLGSGATQVPAVRITVTVSRGSDSIALSGFRTPYAP